MEETLFAEVLLPLALHGTFTYRIPRKWNDTIYKGYRVIVPFGAKTQKLYTGIVTGIHHQAPKEYTAKYIEDVIDDYPLINDTQFRLWNWMADYYLCTPGEVMNAALPAGLKLNSRTKVFMNQAQEFKHDELNDEEFLIIEALEKQSFLYIEDIGKILNRKNPQKMLKQLLEKNLIITDEEVNNPIKPLMIPVLDLHPHYDNEENLQKLLNQLENSPRSQNQLHLLMAWIQLSDYFSEERKQVRKEHLLKSSGVKDGVLNSLIKKEILLLRKIESSRFGAAEANRTFPVLSSEQQRALEQIEKAFDDGKTSLLHGVTASGKTEIYIHLINEALMKNQQVLYLLPEIALTTQIIQRLQAFFGDKVGIYHSRFSQNERAEVWRRLNGKEGDHPPFQIILGPRSALFLPFENLGLIIVDEEHDHSYKQHDPAPRYHGRDAALYLAHLHGAHAVLGSATPSLESYYNAQQQKYSLIELEQRYGNVQLPEIKVVDMIVQKKKGLNRGRFSEELLRSMQLAHQYKEQTILFQNRRGFAPMLQCNHCEWTPQCKNCDVSLTYHKSIQMLRCHYCGYSEKPPVKCSACGDVEINMLGIGTEKIEEDVSVLLPDIKVARMDLDTTRSKNAYRKIFEDFESRNIDVLVGTQMVTKGLDFDHVSLVGIINADSMMSYPDFRAHERAYQLMAQVSGRAGRRNKQGFVIIQTTHPQHPLIQQVVENNYKSFYELQLNERLNYFYPPHFKLIKVQIKHKDRDVTDAAAGTLANELRKNFKGIVLGPEYPGVARVNNLYIKQLLIKFKRGKEEQEAKHWLKEIIHITKLDKRFAQVRFAVDVDPY
jgi:primosomal protein N' (replication factor Y) (superfamily II helicase)